MLVYYVGKHQKVATFSFYGELKGTRNYYGGIKDNLNLLEVRFTQEGGIKNNLDLLGVRFNYRWAPRTN